MFATEVAPEVLFMDSKALYKLSYGLYVVSTPTPEGFGGSIVDAFIQAGSNPATVILCSMKQNYTNECIKKSGTFGVSVLSKDVFPFTIANFGFQSARNVDKWSRAPHFIHNGLPFINNSCAYLTCKVNHSVELSSHTVFFAEVIDAVDGEGAPLLYAEYQTTDLKQKVIDAFTAYRAMQGN